ncbi:MULTISPECIES: hypothetical protein [unclassified Campylobacter]|uniref:hypothetical protein n=1 Tax=unclassified Campylobacter TaxID=2593542 RepID=UPI0022E9C9C3|nr:MULTISPECIES: hypothetical protein [unclassified Campylobacter]MDA3055667.1 hypothetical protein [Campylobacter sp. CN_NA1]MDA3065069.1 hypothetical protein [Campylobacter sp. CN_NE4]MDA3069226.1 hypothetical protein [Campylobacter sp. CN_NE3]MDA3082154.1 hypothetical protein [Campylobacter sp. CN_EL2]MDA3083789.1 hypothetical protein [Campylobacter sp. CN_NE1]
MENFENWNKKKFDKNLNNAKRNYDLEPIVLLNHDVSIEFIRTISIIVFIVINLIVPIDNWHSKLYAIIFWLPFLQSSLTRYKTHKNSKFIFSKDFIRQTNDGNINIKINLYQILEIKKIKQIFNEDARRTFYGQKQGNLLSGTFGKIFAIVGISLIIFIYVFGLLVVRKDPFGLLIIFSILIFIIIYFLLPQFIYHIKSGGLKNWLNDTLEIQTQDEVIFVVIANNNEYNELKEYFLSRLNINIDKI